MLINCLYEMHGATIKMVMTLVSTTEVTNFYRLYSIYTMVSSSLVMGPTDCVEKTVTYVS